ncbi:MAG: arginase family protein [Candidatus Sulfotelmatobacter sp.]
MLQEIWGEITMGRTIAYVGVPTSLGSYSPGQEKAPQAFRDAGFPEMLRKEGLTVVDHGDLSVRRWRPDRKNPRAQHWEAVTACVQETDARLSEGVSQRHILVVIGGNCTVEFGVVAANLRKCESLGLIYLDLHADMNTPESTADGALDWMGVAHMLGLNGAVPQLASCGPRYPLISPTQVHLVGFDPDSATEWERSAIRDRGIAASLLADVAQSPAGCADTILSKWAMKFERLLVHLDVDVIDFNELPLAENYSKNKGLSYSHTLELLGVLFKSPKVVGFTLTEINPDHGAEDGSTIQRFAQDMSRLLALLPS